eukprot:CAMPEP_0168338634 /NCGR_PEP_ID=MMETSP0213-20121227/12962_1 /TAXON_ID=151035 /ORGANISM="Euplotes harpa, Strain FSP1.4" /LENGTH=206 /DNA_ID=CAMNT_0008344471 /DNA_START=12 /DNA_END=632 /DNA_ORIENTATION=+
MFKALGLLCLIMISATAQVSETVRVPAVPTEPLNTKMIELIPVDPNSAGLDFLLGFAEGLAPKAAASIKTCVHDISPDTFNRISDDIHKMNWKHPKDTAHAIADITKVFVEVIKDCKSTSKDVVELIYKLEHALNEVTLIEGIIKLALHPISFAKTIGSIVSGFKSHNYIKAGQGLGSIVGKIIGTNGAIVIDDTKAAVQEVLVSY